MGRSLILKGIPDRVYDRLVKKKLEDGFADGDWVDWFSYLTREVKAEDNLGEVISRNTKAGLLELWVQNFAKNLPYIWLDSSIAELIPPQEEWFKKPSIVIGRGPSVFRKGHVELLSEFLQEGKFSGYVVATDGMFLECLKRGVVPDFVVNVDGHPTKIVRWFGDPDFTTNNPEASEKDVKRNEEDVNLVDGMSHKLRDVKVILSVTASPNVYRRVKQIGMKVFWWIPLLDDVSQNESLTRLMKMMTKCEKHPRGVPAMVAGGNCGCASWVFCHSVLRSSPIGLIGIDLGYPEDVLFDETSYYQQIMDGVDRDPTIAVKVLTELYNPYFDVKVKVDPVFEHYRQAWLELLDRVEKPVLTVNCTEGGSLFSLEEKKGLRYMRFEDFLEEFGNGEVA